VHKKLKYFLLLLNGIIFFCSQCMEIQKKEFILSKDFSITMSPIIKQAKSLVINHRLNKTDGKPFVAVAGCTAVGKSYFSEQLVHALNKEKVKAAILHLDDFMEPLAVKNPLFHPHLDYVKAHAVIQEILDGAISIVKPTWDLSGAEFFKTTNTLDLKDIDLIVFEGEFTLCDSDSYDFLKYSSLRILMDAENDDLINWNWDRKRGIKEKTKEEFTTGVLRGLIHYRDHIAPTIKYAQYLVLQNKNHEYTLVEKNII